MNVAPNRPNTSVTVDDVGSPRSLNRSSTMMLVATTAMNTIITSRNEKLSGCMMPWRATSIIPADMSAPVSTPIDAMTRMVLNVPALAPIADDKKLTASLLTPTNRPNAAKISMNTVIIR